LVTPSTLGLELQEEGGPDRSIARLATARTAFVGRALRGPVNRAVLIESFAEFQRTFGGLWQPSRLSYAVEQFFENGGREALVVRVVNGARAASLTLPAGASALTLQAASPGTREFLRASIDYDNIPAQDSFNLTVQRVRVQGGSHVEDQEIFPQLSVQPAHERYAGEVLRRSELVRVVGAVPQVRPDHTRDAAGTPTYVSSNADGDDGAPLTDYDLIGSEVEHTGLFALDACDYFNLLCIPPLARTEDVGLTVLLVAARYCKDRGAVLVVDPRYAWHTADDALAGLRDWEIKSENAVMYFPRILAHDKLRGHFESFAPCGAVAGMLARVDQTHPVWGEPKMDDAVLRQGYRPVCLVSEDRRMRLAQRGVNTLQAIRSVSRIGVKPRTLAAGSAGIRDWQVLPARRLALFIVNCIEHGTRWVVAAAAASEAAQIVATQVRNFFDHLYEEGAFGTRPREEAFYVICDRRFNAADGERQGEFQFLIGFAAARPKEFHTYRISHSPAGSRVSPASLNRAKLAEFCPQELEWIDRLANQLQPP
jgi:Bacteriophage tail sheath protein